jgi:hypothetical protein
MSLPEITRAEVLRALSALEPLCGPDVTAMWVQEGLGGWAIHLQAVDSRATDAAARRMGLHRATDWDVTFGGVFHLMWEGRVERVAVDLDASRHVIVRATART